MTNEKAVELLKEIATREQWQGETLKAFELVIKSLSEPKITVFTENQTIRWTDKVFLKDNGDIIDFYGRVIGHINFDEGECNETN